MIGGIVSTRGVRERSGGLALKARPESSPPARSSEAGDFSGAVRDRDFHLEISLHDFGLEKAYGRFLRDKLYLACMPPVPGGLVDLYV